MRRNSKLQTLNKLPPPPLPPCKRRKFDQTKTWSLLKLAISFVTVTPTIQSDNFSKDSALREMEIKLG